MNSRTISIFFNLWICIFSFRAFATQRRTLYLNPKTRSSRNFGRGYKYDYSLEAEILRNETINKNHPYQTSGSVPTSVDWRLKGATSPVRNQGQGETCWAFSTAGAVEGAAIAVGGLSGLTPLSVQYLIDCMGIDCSDSSGTPDDAFQWISKKHNGRMYTFDSYPYKDKDCIFWDPPRDCLSNGTLANVQVSDYTHTIVANETDLMLAVANQPVSVAIFSGLASFENYKEGIYYDDGCENVNQKMLDHAVLLVGYGEENSIPYWIVKNSWTADWGENGYIRMKRNIKSSTGLCGIAIDASFPNLKT